MKRFLKMSLVIQDPDRRVIFLHLNSQNGSMLHKNVCLQRGSYLNFADVVSFHKTNIRVFPNLQIARVWLKGLAIDVT